MAREKIELPEYIKQWHDYVKKSPKKHGKNIKKLCKLIEKVLKKPGVWYDGSDVEAFIEYCRLFRHREGIWAGEVFELSIEQKYFAACVLGIKMMDIERNMERRYFREAALFVARKWGKTMFISALAGYLLMADGEMGAQVWCVATVKTQAGILYKATREFLKGSPILTPPKNPKKHWKTFRDDDNTEIIMHPVSGSFMKAGSKNSAGQEGFNPSAYIIDETQLIKEKDTYTVFSSGAGARLQPIGIFISSFGVVRDGLFDSLFPRCQKVLNGESDEHLFPMMFCIDEDDDPEDRSCWIKANPGIGVRPTMAYIEDEYKKALEDPTLMPSFLARHMNRAVNASMSFFELNIINQCAGKMRREDYEHTYAVGGVDLSETTDLTCASALIPVYDTFKLVQHYFIAEARIDRNSKNDKMAYRSFEMTKAEDPLNRQLLTICQGSTVRKADVTEWYNMLRDEYDMTFWKIGYDRAMASDWVYDMVANGYPEMDKNGGGVLMKVAMGPFTLNAPMRETHALFEDKKIIYSEYNGLFRWCCNNTAARMNANMLIQPDKQRSTGRIDGYLSFLIAYVAYLEVKDLFEENMEYQGGA